MQSKVAGCRLPRSGEVRRRRTHENARVPAAHMNRYFLSTAATIYVVVFAAFLLYERAGLGIAHFFYLAIALVALALGPAWGAAAGGIATVLYTIGVLLEPRAADERDLHDLDADPPRQLHRDRSAARLVRRSLPRGQRRAADPRSARPRHRAAEHAGVRARDRPAPRRRQAVRAARRRSRRASLRRGSRRSPAQGLGHTLAPGSTRRRTSRVSAATSSRS